MSTHDVVEQRAGGGLRPQTCVFLHAPLQQEVRAETDGGLTQRNYFSLCVWIFLIQSCCDQREGEGGRTERRRGF